MKLPDSEPIVRAEPLREAVYDRIIELLCSGEYPPGSVLTEASLSRMLAVSRTPVREALLRLQAEGVLQSSLARGFTVRPLDRRDVVELYPILATLEGLAARSITNPSKAMLKELQSTAAAIVRCGDGIERWRLDAKFHRTLVAAGGNEHLVEMIGQLRINLSRYELTFMREMPSRDNADEQHAQIIAALDDRSPDLAARILDQHWRDGQEQLLDWLS